MPQSSDIRIIKNSGEEALFEPERLRESLRRSGANEQVIEEVASAIEATLKDGMTTREIYRRAFSLLKQRSRPSASRYSLKKAIWDLGPTGFPFERFVGSLLDHDGFKTRVGVYVQGYCVNHEVDVVAERDDHRYMVECKFHGRGRVCDVRIPLYVKSRFDDVARQWRKDGHGNPDFHQCWIVTNTRFTKDALDFGTCSDLVLIGWDYPANEGLKDRIDAAGLHPVTCLSSISKHEKTQILDTGLVLIRDLLDHTDALFEAGISPTRHEKILTEVRELYPG